MEAGGVWKAPGHRPPAPGPSHTPRKSWAPARLPPRITRSSHSRDDEVLYTLKLQKEKPKPTTPANHEPLLVASLRRVVAFTGTGGRLQRNAQGGRGSGCGGLGQLAWFACGRSGLAWARFPRSGARRNGESALLGSLIPREESSAVVGIDEKDVGAVEAVGGGEVDGVEAGSGTERGPFIGGAKVAGDGFLRAVCGGCGLDGDGFDVEGNAGD